VDAYRAALAALGQPQPAYVPYEQIEVRIVRPGDGAVVASTRTSDRAGLSWTLPDVPGGKYVLEAGTDRNRDGVLSGPGELYGRWNGGDLVVVDGPQDGLDFAIAGD
jgi:hypothetical protein